MPIDDLTYSQEFWPVQDAADVLPLLVPLLGSKNNLTRQNAARVIAKLVFCSEKHQDRVVVTANALPLLLPLLSSPDQLTQQCTAAAIDSLACSQAHKVAVVTAGVLPLLVPLLSSMNARTQRHAIHAISLLKGVPEEPTAAIAATPTVPL